MKKFNPETLLKEINSRPTETLYNHTYTHAAVYKYQIAPNLEYAKIWSRRRLRAIELQTCFLIKRANEYVGLVLLGGTSPHCALHCYTLPKFRGSGCLFPAHRSSILPFLFLHEEKENVHLSLKENDFTQTHLSISKKLVVLLNFKETQEDEFDLTIDDCDFSAIQLDFQHPGMTLQQFETTKLELDSMAKRLLQLEAQLESAYGKPISLDQKNFLQNLAQDLKEYQNKLVKRAVDFHRNEVSFIEEEFME